MKINKKMLVSKTFLINSGVCILSLLLICFLAINNNLKGTYSTDKTCLMTEDGEVCYESRHLEGRYKWNEYVSLEIFDGSSWYNKIPLDFKSSVAEFDGILFALGDKGRYELGYFYQIPTGTDYYKYYLFYIDKTNLNSEGKAKIMSTGECEFGNSCYFYDENGTKVLIDTVSNLNVFNVINIFNGFDVNYYVNMENAHAKNFWNWFVDSVTPYEQCYYNSSTKKYEWTNLTKNRELNEDVTTPQECLSLNYYEIVYIPNAENGVTEREFDVVEPGESVTLPNVTIEDEDYKFLGWYSMGVKIGEAGSKYTPNADVDLYAKWEINGKHVVSFYSNGGTGKMNIQVFEWENSQNLYANTFTRTGYDFVGWNTKADGSGKSYVDCHRAIFTENTDLYAQWDAEKYTVTFDSNSGTGSMDSQEFVYGEEKGLSANKFTKEGFVFKSWNTLKGGSPKTAYADEEVISVTADMTLYAQWQPIVSSNDINLSSTDKLIKLDIGVTKASLQGMINLGPGCKADIGSKKVNNVDILFTGSKVKIYDNKNNLYTEYTVWLKGDVSGDGGSSLIDYVKIYNHLDESDKSNYLTGVYLKAADMNEDGQVTLGDYVKLYNKLS